MENKKNSPVKKQDGDNMKKMVSIILTMVLIAGTISLMACGSSEEVENDQAATEEEESSHEETEETSSQSEWWSDVPVYAGAKEIQKGSWAIPADDGEFSKVTWKYYECSDSAAKVSAYYKDEMPEEDWNETFWMESQDTSWGYYYKNNQEDGAMVWVSTDGNKTIIAVMRGGQ